MGYLNNQLFSQALIKYQQAKKADPESEQTRQAFAEVTDHLWLLVDHVAGWKIAQLGSNQDVESVKSDMITYCYQALDRFNPSKGKAFNFFTTCALNALKQSYRTEQNFQNFKEKYKQHLIRKGEFN